MKKVFISYSFLDSELYVVNLLFDKLKEEGYVVESSENTLYAGELLSNQIEYKIKKSDLFIGIITNNSKTANYVFNELRIAKGLNKNVIMVVEKGVDAIDKSYPYILFNRENPQEAIDKILKLNNSVRSNSNNTELIEDILAIGGVVLGIAAIIALLSGKK